jgi:hypothetical protein
MRSIQLALMCVVTAAFAPLVSPLAAAPSPPPATAPAAEPALAADASVDSILDALDRRGKTLKEFTASVRLNESDPALGISNVRVGQVWFQKKSENDARFRVVFDKKVQGKIALDNSKIEYLLDDGWLTDRDYPKKTEVKRQVVQPGEKINLLKLGEGPFPLPIGQSKADVRANFNVSKPAAAGSDPPNTLRLTLEPRAGTPLAKRFTSLDVWVDRESHMPVRVDTIDAAGGEQRQTDLTRVVVNPPGGLKDADFTLPPIDASWSRSNEPMRR